VEPDPDVALAEKATALSDAIDEVVGPWLEAAVATRAADAGLTGPVVEEVAARAAAEARATVVLRIRALLAQDIDEQATTPLALLRGAIGPATAALQELGVPPVDRDEFAERAFPADLYALSPAAFEDVAEELRTPGLEWGAAKAFVHLRRRRGEGGPRH
jgi:hypothetical protein